MLNDTWDFITGLSAAQLISYFWPFFLFDLTRYVVFDVLILTLYLPRRKRNKQRRAKARRLLFHEKPLVSVIVPGKNEGKHIPRLAESLTRQTYKKLEIVIVDDGSDDDTEIICRKLHRDGKIDQYVRNEVRGGKASAANTALYYSTGKYVIHLDADSELRYDSIETILLPFYMDANIAAVGGDIRVANLNQTMATRTQAIEYFKGISTGRTVSSMLGILRIIAGAYGAFRRDTLDRLGGWDVGPGLDGDITMKIRKLGLKVVHEPHAVCYTNVPTSFRKLARQRFRWDRSMVRFRARKHVDVLMPTSNFRLSNFVATVENLFYNLFLNFKWWFYVAQVIFFYGALLQHIIVVNYLLYTLANLAEFLVATVLLRKTLRKQDLLLFLYLPLMPLYTGLYLRIVRTYAYIMEFIHKASYADRWNPWKVSRVVKKDGL
ncbi:MAG: glycosyltransferase [Candidatus Thiodiazotropha endolucinida]|nr:glycosyltransferase [Candidatus Thiodiazotropha taylori]MCW4320318.1 glycosyltransferase [Candidatus Thiodiazotropha taylori]